MREKRVFAFLMMDLSLLITFFAYRKLQFVGFPDGHVTDFEQAEKFLLQIFIGGNFLFVPWFAFLGFSGCFGKRLYFSVAIYAIFIFLFLLAVFCLAKYLDNGVGG